MRSSFEREFYRPRRRFQWKAIAKSAARFAATVVCSALLAVWISIRSPSSVHRRMMALREAASTPPQLPPSQGTKRASRGNSAPAGETEVLYARHLVEILRVLRADRDIRGA